MTVVYDMVSGQLIWVEAGRTSDVFSMFLKQLSPEYASDIEAVTMDMGPAYQKSVQDYLPDVDILFDRFHVMKILVKPAMIKGALNFERQITKVKS